jgi:hypothetical protein
MHDYSYNLLITCESHHEPFINPSGSISNLSGTHQESSGTNQKPIRNPSGTIRNCQEPSETFRKHQEPSGNIRNHQDPSGSIKNPSGTHQEPSATHQEPGVAQMLVLQIYRVDHLTGSPLKILFFLPPFVLASPPEDRQNVVTPQK